MIHKREEGGFSMYTGIRIFHLCCGLREAKEGMNPNCCNLDWDKVTCETCLEMKDRRNHGEGE